MKKEIPLQLLQTVEAFLKKYSDCVTAIKEADSYYTIKDRDMNSKFYLKIFKEKPQNISSYSTHIYIERLPKNISTTNSGIIALKYNNIQQELESWGELIRAYNNTQSIFDDPILNAYQKEFYLEFKIVDDDADYVPFNTNQLLFLDNYLQNLSSNIQKYQNKENKLFIEDIKQESEKLRDQLTILSKNQVMKKITSIWAKLQKGGLEYAKEFIIEIKKEFMKYIVKNVFELAEKTILQ